MEVSHEGTKDKNIPGKALGKTQQRALCRISLVSLEVGTKGKAMTGDVSGNLVDLNPVVPCKPLLGL